MITTAEKVLFLKGIDLFSALAGEDLAEIAVIAEEIERDAGETIVVEGEPGDALYFVLDGRVRVHRGDTAVAELGAREVFGEMALLDAAPRSASVSALTDVTLLAIGRDDFDDIMRDRPEVAIGVIKVLVRRLRAATAAASAPPRPPGP
jgi:CRP-like cAMP-binding protein